MVTYAANQTWSGGGLSAKTFGLNPHLWVFPWTSEPVSYRVLPNRGSFGTDRSLGIAWEYSLYRIFYTGFHQRVFVGNATQISCALTVAQCVCVSLWFATGTFACSWWCRKSQQKHGVPSYSQGCSCAQYIAKYICGVSKLFTHSNCQGRIYTLSEKGNLHISERVVEWR